MSDLVILNNFGITPTKNYTAAGYDFYIPNISITLGSPAEIEMILEAFAASYKKSVEELLDLSTKLNSILESQGIELSKSDMLNILHLYLALTPPDDVDYYLTEEYADPDTIDIFDELNDFVSDRLIYDENKEVYGLNIYAGDYILINSGIKVGLPENTAGIFFNKSGKGNQGFDTRACVVDEDYSGYVHMSMAFDKQLVDPIEIYCGDKLSQLVVLPLVKTEVKELDEDAFNEFHKNSKRGSNAFGSSDIVH